MLNRKSQIMTKVTIQWGELLLCFISLALGVNLMLIESPWFMVLIVFLFLWLTYAGKRMHKAIIAMKAHQQSGMIWLFALSFIISFLIFAYSYFHAELFPRLINWGLVGMVFSVLVFLGSIYFGTNVLQVIEKHLP